MEAKDGTAYESLNEAAYDRIKDALRSGVFEPGQGLATRVIATKLGVSATPVREALGRLVAQRALDLDPRTRAAVVPHITQDFLNELYDLRLVLEGMAVQAAAVAMTDGQLTDLQRLDRELDGLEPRLDCPDYLDRSEAFFFGIYAAAHMPILYALIESIWARSSVILGFLAKRRPSEFSISKQRRKLLEAMAQRDGPAAQEAIASIVQSTRSMLLALVRQDIQGKPSLQRIK